MDRKDMEAQVEDRCDNYAMLSRLYRCEVDAELLEDLIGSPVIDRTGNSRFDEGYAMVRSFLEGPGSVEEKKSELAIDYCLTFLGYGIAPEKADATGMNAAYPYESCYRTGSKTLGGDQCADVSAAYRALAFAPTRERIVAEDHIACELEFMQFLACSELTDVRVGDEASVRQVREAALSFVREHLLSWAEAFEQMIGDFSGTTFYQGLAKMTCGWLEIDLAYLELATSSKEGD